MPNSYRSHKRYLLLNMINHLGSVSRKKMAVLTDYRPASISAIIKELLDEQLLVEGGHYSSGHGRKRALLEINKDHLCAIGIAFSASTVTCIITQFSGNILQKIETEIPPHLPKQELADLVAEQARELLKTFADKEIVGIGICDPLYDPTNYRRGDSLLSSYTHFNDWVHLDLKPKLEALSSLKVNTFSAVTLPALAEQRFGVAKGVDDFICIELSNGIGASLFCGGIAIAGFNGVAGEIGHTVVEMNDGGRDLCYCGKPGCVERNTAYPALAADILGALDSGVFSVLSSYYDRSEPLTVQDIRMALDAGDKLCMHYVKLAAERIGVAIANTVNLLNPELIVLHGFMLELGAYFLDRLEMSIRENTLSLANHFEIRTSASLESELPLGVAAELFSSYLRINDYKWVYQMQTNEEDDEFDMEEMEEEL